MPGDFIGGDVRELTTYAIVNGVRREIETVSLDAELAGDMPAQVVSAGGVSGRSGTIQWAQSEDVQSREVSPWHKPGGWPPSSGDRVQVYVTDGVTSWPRFTGVIDKSSGAVGGGMQSTVIDYRDQLNKPFSHEALLRLMPPNSSGEDFRGLGLDHHYLLVSALRSVNIHNVTPPVASMEVDVPLQGSAWPARGTCIAATGSGSNSFPNFQRAPWGYAASHLEATYTPRTGKSLSGPIELGLMVAPDHAGTASVSAGDGVNLMILRVSTTKTVTARYVDGGVETIVATITAGNFGSSERVQLNVENGVWTLESDNGSMATGSMAVTGGNVTRFAISASSNARIAGVQLRHPTTAPRNIIRWTPTMRFERPSLWAPAMRMSPNISGRSAADLVDEICKATLTASWFDESGVLQLVPSDRLRVREPVQIVTTLDDITALEWEDSLLSVRSAVRVNWKQAVISLSRQHRIHLWQGSNNTMAAGDTIENFATPESGVEWFGVDRTVVNLNDSNWGAANSQVGTLTGAHFTNADGDELTTDGRTLTVDAFALGPVGILITHAAGALGSNVSANLATSPSAIALRSSLRNESLPIVRGMGRGELVDEAATSGVFGPSYAPALEHDLGQWGTTYGSGGSMAEAIADFVAVQVTSPTPTVTGLSVTYDPRRQLGDVIIIESGILDVTIRALIVGISESHAPGDHSQDLTVRIISVTSTRKVTYAELEAAWAGSNYAAMEAVWAGLTYADFENDPLEGA